MKYIAQYLSNAWSYIRNHARVVGIIGVILLVIVVILVARHRSSGEPYTATSRDLRQSVTVSGRVEMAQEVDLEFATSGVVKVVNVIPGQSVSRGTLLAQLTVSDLEAQRAKYAAQVSRAQLDASRDQISLEGQRQEFARFESDMSSELSAAVAAYFTSGVQALPDNDRAEDLDPPVVTGAFKNPNNYVTLDNALGIQPLIYHIYVENVRPNTKGIRYYGIEKGYSEGVDGIPIPLGDSGVFVTIDDLSKYLGSDWIISLPNTASATYATDYSTFVSTITSLRKDRITKYQDIRDTTTRLAGSGSETEIDLTVARAELANINAEIANRTLYAPFDGVVGMVDIKKGDTVSTSTTAVSVIGKEQNYLVTLRVPEGSIAKVRPGLSVELQLDALRERTYKGSVVSVSPSETYVDGVPVYETVVQFIDPDESIRSGMNVTATIIIEEKKGVVAIPRSALLFEGDATFVVNSNGDRVPVVVGMKSSDDMFEIVQGLAHGDIVTIVSSNSQ